MHFTSNERLYDWLMHKSSGLNKYSVCIGHKVDSKFCVFSYENLFNSYENVENENRHFSNIKWQSWNFNIMYVCRTVAQQRNISYCIRQNNQKPVSQSIIYFYIHRLIKLILLIRVNLLRIIWICRCLSHMAKLWSLLFNIASRDDDCYALTTAHTIPQIQSINPSLCNTDISVYSSQIHRNLWLSNLQVCSAWDKKGERLMKVYSLHR